MCGHPQGVRIARHYNDFIPSGPVPQRRPLSAPQPEPSGPDVSSDRGEPASQGESSGRENPAGVEQRDIAVRPAGADQRKRRDGRRPAEEPGERRADGIFPSSVANDENRVHTVSH
jgi:hypothetical protein